MVVKALVVMVVVLDVMEVRLVLIVAMIGVMVEFNLQQNYCPTLNWPLSCKITRECLTD